VPHWESLESLPLFRPPEKELGWRLRCIDVGFDATQRANAWRCSCGCFNHCLFTASRTLSRNVQLSL
jgi:hypothetical protein